MSEHAFSFTGRWSGFLNNGKGDFHIAQWSSTFSVPREMGGPGAGTNPEELLVAAFGTCHLITLAAIAQFKAVPIRAIEVESRAFFEVDQSGPRLIRVEHHPKVTVDAEDLERVHDDVIACIAMAEQSCLVSRAVAGNVKVSAVGTVRAGS